jgi:hypothetical protein
MLRLARSRSRLIVLALAALLALAQPPLSCRSRGVPTRNTTEQSVRAEPEEIPAPTVPTVYLAGELADEQLIALGASLAACEPDAVLLLDAPDLSPYLKAFLDAYRPERVVPVGTFREGPDALKARLGVAPGRPLERPEELFLRAPRVVVCPKVSAGRRSALDGMAAPRARLLQAAWLAGLLRAPLVSWDGSDRDTLALLERLARWRTTEVLLVGRANRLREQLPDLTCQSLPDEAAVVARGLELLAAAGKIETVVVANPADLAPGLGGTSALAPWVAVQKRAALLLTNEAGDDLRDVVARATQRQPLRRVENVLLLGPTAALPTELRPNPINGDKDRRIEMEPLTPTGPDLCTFAVGRLFGGDDPALVPLTLARQRLMARARSEPLRALVVSNVGGHLPLLETFSRSTSHELANAGFKTESRYRSDVKPDEVRELLKQQDLFLYEGHCTTLTRDYRFTTWEEPIPPSFAFLQSCLMLESYKVQPLLRRGAVGAIGTSTRTYSASGGACSLAFLDAVLYDDMTTGAALRHAKNFLLMYSQFKEQRLEQASRGGANLRAAWAFTLWGDPTLKLPRPAAAPKLPPIRHEVRGTTLIVHLPPGKHDTVSTGRYQTQLPPNGRLAGLLQKKTQEKGQPLVPLAFLEVPLNACGWTPTLHSRLSSKRWLFSWDPRREVGYLLVALRPEDTTELRFQVRWQRQSAAREVEPEPEQMP